MQDYTTRLNKKVRKLGLRHALSQKLKEGNLVVVSDLRAETHKTNALAKAMDLYGIGGKRGSPAFILDDARDEDDGEEEEEEEEERDVRSVGGLDINFKVASGNVPNVRVANQLGANVYDILKHEKLILSLAAITALEGRLMP
uniref:Large ribosomal subunit protein uL4m n=1 Tax=Pseudictyota dubia TaxID=2749911 RepID=A0A7R9W9Q3_9STRA